MSWVALSADLPLGVVYPLVCSRGPFSHAFVIANEHSTPPDLHSPNVSLPETPDLTQLSDMLTAHRIKK